jgi:hypothetical protein
MSVAVAGACVSRLRLVAGWWFTSRPVRAIERPFIWGDTWLRRLWREPTVGLMSAEWVRQVEARLAKTRRLE